MRRQELQDASGVLAVQRGGGSAAGILDIVQATTPTNADAGYAVGCTWRNTAGAAGTSIYVNVGSNTSATWVNIA